MVSEFRIHDDGSLRFGNRLCIPSNVDLKREIILEAYNSTCAVLPKSMKMYRDLKKNFWLSGIKGKIVQYVTRCWTR